MNPLNPATNLAPSQIIKGTLAHGGPMPAATGNPGTDTTRFYQINGVGRGQYAGPVAVPDNTKIGTNDPSAGFNQAMIEISQHFEPMIQISVLNNPRWWHDRVPRSAFPLFNGTVHETRIFRGSLMKYAGLDEWQDIDPYPTATNNPCGSMGYSTPTYGWEALSWRGKRAAWGSDPICAEQFKFFDQAQQQLAWTLASGAEYGIQMQEVWNRDLFIYQSVNFKRSFIMSAKYTGKTTDAHYYYNPFIKFDGVGSGSEGHALASTINRAFILFHADVDVEPVNFDILDKVRASLQIRCPSAAVSKAGGEPIFALAMSHDDVEKYVRGNEEERRYWIEANPQALIKHYDFATAVFRRWMITNDNNQLRFKRTKLIKNFSAADALAYGLDALGTDMFVGRDVWVAVSVDPLIPSTDRVGVNGTVIPEDNPEYIDAELAIAPVFMNQVFQNQFVPSVTSLGSGTSFGPAAGLNGTWRWLNIQDRETNPLGNVGNFYGTFEIVPKPETHVFHTISFLYKRCNVALPSYCPMDNGKINPVLKDSTTLASTVRIAVGQSTAVLRTKEMLKCSPGDVIALTATAKGDDTFAYTGAGTHASDVFTSATCTFSSGKWTLDVDGTSTTTYEVAGTADDTVIYFDKDDGADANYIKVVRTPGGYTGGTSSVNCTVYGVQNAYTLEVQFAANASTEKGFVAGQAVTLS